MNISGIYQIKSVIKPERVYVGSTVNLYKRWESHRRMLKNNNHPNIKLQRHYNKYGETDLLFSFIEPCFQQFLTIREQYYIDTLKPCFNIAPRAGSNLGFKQSEEFCENRSKIMRGNKIRKGLLHSKEVKLQMSNSHKGNIPWNKGNSDCWSEERLKQMSEWMKANSPMRGKHHTKEAKDKMSNAHMGNKYWVGRTHKEETLVKMRVPKSEEHKQHLKEAWVIRRANKKIA